MSVPFNQLDFLSALPDAAKDLLGVNFAEDPDVYDWKWTIGKAKGKVPVMATAGTNCGKADWFIVAPIYILGADYETLWQLSDESKSGESFTLTVMLHWDGFLSVISNYVRDQQIRTELDSIETWSPDEAHDDTPIEQAREAIA